MHRERRTLTTLTARDLTDPGPVPICVLDSSLLMGGTLPPEVEARVATCEGVDRATVEVVWDPPWNPGMMTESARLGLGFF